MMYKVGLLKSQYFRVGHAGMMLIPKSTGIPEYFDFGRYTTRLGWGRVRGAETDPTLRMEVRADFDKHGIIRNAEEISDYLLSRPHATHGDGIIYFSFYYKMNYALAKAHIQGLQQRGSVRYTTFTPNATNCSRFVCGSILAGGTSPKDKLKLLLTPTLRASPVGTVVDVGYESGVFRQKPDGKLENFNMTRMDNLALLYKNMKGSFTSEAHSWQTGHFFDPFERPANVPESAQWLGGQGEANWILLSPWGEDGRLRATAYYPDGRLSYDIIVKPQGNQNIDPDRPHQFIHDCTRIFVTVKQDGRQVRLVHEADVGVGIQS
jgi:hypothetical protein